MSDQSDRNIVIFIFVFAFFYLNYLRIKIDIRNDWENMRCNPMNLWTSSFFKDPKTANANFNTCINSLSSESINIGLRSAFIKQNQAMEKIADQETILSSYLTDINNEINGHGGLVDQYKVNETKIDDIKDKQINYQTVNEVLTTKDESTNNLYNFTNNIKTIFDNIKNYLPTLQNTLKN
jgi:hypothetical protein